MSLPLGRESYLSAPDDSEDNEANTGNCCGMLQPMNSAVIKMPTLWLGLISLFTVACGPSNLTQIGRYQQINNPNPPLCAPIAPNVIPTPGCGVTILDTQTGAIFIHRGIDWEEDNPHTGKAELHNLYYSLTTSP